MRPARVSVAVRQSLANLFHRPAFVLLLLAPFVGEVLSTSTPLIVFPSPTSLPFEAALYGGGALLIREVCRRRGLGTARLLLLGAAYGIVEEALVVRSWFAREFFDDTVAAAYSRAWGTNWLEATHLTLFHAVVSIWCSIALVELLFPQRAATPWAGRRGLSIAGLGLAGVLVLSLSTDAFFSVPVPQFVGAAGLAAALAALALYAPRMAIAPPRVRFDRHLSLVIAIAMTAHFVLVWTLRTTTAPWPLAIVLCLFPCAVAVAYGRRSAVANRDVARLRVVTGLVVPLVALDLLIGASGRVDLLATAALAIAGLVALHRRAVPAADGHARIGFVRQS